MNIYNSFNTQIYHVVYLTTNLINGKIYIGVRSSWNIDNDPYLGSGLLLNNSIKKYGKQNFKRQILFYCLTRDEAFNIEEQIVDKIFINRKDTYNLVIGGNGQKTILTNKNIGSNNGQAKKWLLVLYSGEILYFNGNSDKFLKEYNLNKGNFKNENNFCYKGIQLFKYKTQTELDDIHSKILSQSEVQKIMDKEKLDAFIKNSNRAKEISYRPNVREKNLKNLEETRKKITKDSYKKSSITKKENYIKNPEKYQIYTYLLVDPNGIQYILKGNEAKKLLENNGWKVNLSSVVSKHMVKHWQFFNLTKTPIESINILTIDEVNAIYRFKKEQADLKQKGRKRPQNQIDKQRKTNELKRLNSINAKQQFSLFQ